MNKCQTDLSFRSAISLEFYSELFLEPKEPSSPDDPDPEPEPDPEIDYDKEFELVHWPE